MREKKHGNISSLMRAFGYLLHQDGGTISCVYYSVTLWRLHKHQQHGFKTDNRDPVKSFPIYTKQQLISDQQIIIKYQEGSISCCSSQLK